MRAFVIVNDLQEVGYRQTTSLLIASLVRHKCQVVVAAVDCLSMKSNEDGFSCTVTGSRLPASCVAPKDVAKYLSQAAAETTSQSVAAEDLLMIRTNPGRDTHRIALHHSFLHLASMIEGHGIRVINSPGHLSFFADKASLAIIDRQYRPDMLVSAQIDAVCEFAGNAPGEIVVKPLVGSRGQNVLRVNGNERGLSDRLKATFGQTLVIAQHFVVANHPGDRRIVVWDGEILEREGHIAGIERHPAAGDFRGNLHAGGSACPVSLNSSERTAARHAAKRLFEHGIRLAGVDLVGDQIIELNVFSTGGLYDANRFADADFSEMIVGKLLDH